MVRIVIAAATAAQLHSRYSRACIPAPKRVSPCDPERAALAITAVAQAPIFYPSDPTTDDRRQLVTTSEPVEIRSTQRRKRSRRRIATHPLLPPVVSLIN